MRFRLKIYFYFRRRRNHAIQVDNLFYFPAAVENKKQKLLFSVAELIENNGAYMRFKKK